MALRDIDWGGKRINAALTKAQVEKSPAIDTDRPVSRQHEIEYYRYFGYPYYWEAGPYLWGAYPYPYPLAGRAPSLEEERHWDWAGEDGDPHLRSSAAVIGYHIAATDGDMGHVEDFLVDDATWAIRYMIVDTRNWWPGKKVLVSPEWIERVDWSDSKVHVGMTQEQIKKSPEYDPSGSVERDYEARLHDHYGVTGPGSSVISSTFQPSTPPLALASSTHCGFRLTGFCERCGRVSAAPRGCRSNGPRAPGGATIDVLAAKMPNSR